MRPAANRDLLAGKWGIETALFLAAALVETSFFGQLVAFTPQHLLAMGVPQVEIGYFSGLVASVTMFIAFPALQRWGSLADQLTHKQVIVRSFLLDAVVALAAIIFSSPWIFLLGRAVSLAAMDSNGLILNFVEHINSPGRTRLHIALLTLAPQLGVFLGPLAGGFVVDMLGFQALIAFNLLLILLAALSFHLLAPNMDVVQDQAPILRILKKSFDVVIRSPRISLLYLTLTLMVAAWMMVFTYLPLSVRILSPETGIGKATGLVVGLGGLAGLVIGWVLDRIRNPGLDWIALAAWLGAGAAVSYSIQHAGDFLQLAALWALLLGLATAGFARLYRLVVRSTDRASLPLVLSLAILPVNGGMILGPVVGSYLSSPQVQQVYPAAALFSLLGLGALLLARWLPTPGKEPYARQ